MAIEAGSFIFRAKFEENVIVSLDVLKAHFKDIGVNITSVSKSAENMNNTFTKTYSTWLNLMFLGQNLNKVFGGLRDLVWQVYLNSIFMELGLQMLNALSPILDPIIDSVLDLVDAFDALPENVKITVSVTVLGIGILASLLPIITNLALLSSSLAASGGILGALGLAFAALTPFILPVIAIIALLWLMWQFNFGKIQEHAKAILFFLQQTFNGIVIALQGLFDMIFGILTINPQKVIDGFKKMSDGIFQVFDGLGSIVTEFTGFLIDIGGAIFNWGRNWGNLLRDALGDLLSGIITWGTNAGGAMFDAGVKFVQGLLDGINSLASQVGTAMWNMIPQPFKGWIQSTVSGAGAAIGALGSSVMKIFGLAEGGVVTRPTLAMIGENGPEAVVPLGGRNGQNIYGQNQVNFSPNVYVNVASIASAGDIERLKRELNERWVMDYRRLIGGW